MSNNSNSENLFLPNNHSNYKTKWRNVSPSVWRKVEQISSKYYDLGYIKDIKQNDEWEKMSNNFKVSSIKDGILISSLLRKNINIKNIRKINSIEKISSFLRLKGIVTPKIKPTKTGENCCHSDSHYWQLFEFISGDHYRGTESQLKNVAMEISKMHTVFSEIPFEVEKKAKIAWKKNEWEDMFERSKFGGTELDNKIYKEKEYITDTINWVGNNYEPTIQTFQAIHGDLHPQNTLYQGNKLVGILDFDDTKVSERIRDFGNALHRFVRQYVVFQNKPWKEELPKGIFMFINSYSKIININEKELRTTEVLMKDELLRKLFVGLKQYYVDGDDRHISHGEFEKKINLLKETRFFGKILKSY